MNATHKSLKNPGKIVRGENNDYYLTDGRGYIWIINKAGKFWLGEMNLASYIGKSRKSLVQSILRLYPIH